MAATEGCVAAASGERRHRKACAPNREGHAVRDRVSRVSRRHAMALACCIRPGTDCQAEKERFPRPAQHSGHLSETGSARRRRFWRNQCAAHGQAGMRKHDAGCDGRHHAELARLASRALPGVVTWAGRRCRTPSGASWAMDIARWQQVSRIAPRLRRGAKRPKRRLLPKPSTRCPSAGARKRSASVKDPMAHILPSKPDNRSAGCRSRAVRLAACDDRSTLPAARRSARVPRQADPHRDRPRSVPHDSCHRHHHR